jgi:hypothetical protein
MKQIHKLYTSALTFLLSLGIPIKYLYAAPPITNPAIPNSFATDLPEVAVAKILARLFSAGLAAGSIVFLGYLAFGAFKWMTAGGEPAQLNAAKQTMTQAIIGLVIMASIFAIASLLALVLGLNENCDFPNEICWPTF